MSLDRILVPYIRKEVIFSEAERIVERYHPSYEAPIPIEQILERDFGIDIRVLPDLKATLGSLAYTSWAARAIFVDRHMWEVEPAWYHFSLAHELGHIVLHPQLFRGSSHKTREEYDRFRKSLSEDDRVRMEKQAPLFAGALLAPARTLIAVADECVELARKEGVILTPYLEVDWPYIMKGMADRLEVTEQTVSYRFQELRLLERYL